MPLGEAIARLEQPTVYEIEIQQKKYQVEVELLRDTGNHLEIMIAVDGGVLPRSLRPLTQIVSRERFPSA